MERIKLRSLLIKMMLGCLIVAAGVAVVAILAGSFDEVTQRALWTIFAAVVHIFILFGLISMTASTNELTKRSSDFVINASIIIAVMSFFTSVFGIWEVLEGEITGKLYFTYLVALVVLLHGKTLIDVEVVYNKVKPYVLANYVFIGIVAAMLLGLVYHPDGGELLEGFYGRLLAASAVIDVTLSVIVAVMHRLYLQRHPELKPAQQTHRSFGVWRVIIILLLIIFVVPPILFFLLISMLWR